MEKEERGEWRKRRKVGKGRGNMPSRTDKKLVIKKSITAKHFHFYLIRR
jgi:hypothetical protein